MKKVMIVGGTHGTEKIFQKVFLNLKSLPTDIVGVDEEIKINLLISNTLAVTRGIRYLEKDLNRSFPGNPNGCFEEKLAFKLKPIVDEQDVVIDIHSTESGLKDAVILTRITEKNLNLVRATNAKNVLLMDLTVNNALISSAKIGIGLEFGSDNSLRAIRKTTDCIKLILNQLGSEIKVDARATAKKRFFRITRIINKPEGFIALDTIKNYELVKKDEVYAYHPKTGRKLRARTDFYPILFGEPQYEHFGFMGFLDEEIANQINLKLKKVNVEKKEPVVFAGGWLNGLCN